MNLPDMRDMVVASRQVATKSAMNPALWLCAVCTPAALIISAYVASPLSYLMYTIGIIPVLNACWSYNHFMRKDPNRLQSERYLLEQQVLARIGVNTPGASREVTLDINKVIVENPLLRTGVGDE